MQPELRPTWKQFSFLPTNGQRKPILSLDAGDAHADVTRVNLHASVSHDGDFVNAFVIAERSVV